MKATSIADAPSHEGLSATRIDCLREELQQELARLTHSLAAAWPQEVQVENRNRFSVRHTDAGSLTSDERMRVGTYGRCAVCGLSIPYERLQVLPETCTCIECGA
jgi:RNA polymerase-binding transcription factor DksA